MKKLFHLYWSKDSYDKEPSPNLAAINMDDVWPDRISAGTLEIEVGEIPEDELFEELKAVAKARTKARLLEKLAELEDKP